MIKITPIANREIIRYRKVANKVLDTFTNQVLYTGKKAQHVYNRVNQIGMYNANVLDSGSKQQFKFMMIA
jgi:ribosomal protein S7